MQAVEKETSPFLFMDNALLKNLRLHFSSEANFTQLCVKIRDDVRITH